MSVNWGQGGSTPFTGGYVSPIEEARRRFGSEVTDAPKPQAPDPANIDKPATAEWVPRTHPFVLFAKRSPLAKELLADLPEFQAATKIADRADELLKAERRVTVSDMVLPHSADEVTEEWIEADIQRRTTTVTSRQRTQSMKELSFHARQRAIEVVESNAIELMAALDKRMQDFASRLTEHVDKLGDTVHSAADAITEDVPTVWKTIADMNTEYINIRGVQTALYRCDTLDFDRTGAGDGYHGDNPDARLYLFRNINTAAPRWRGYIDGRGHQQAPEVPFPNDPTEFLIWSVRANLGMWCPTPAQIAEEVAKLGPLPGYKEFQASKGNSNKPERSGSYPSNLLPAHPMFR